MIEEKVIIALREKQSDVAASILGGAATSYEDYKRMIGMYIAFENMVATITEIMKDE